MLQNLVLLLLLLRPGLWRRLPLRVLHLRLLRALTQLRLGLRLLMHTGIRNPPQSAGKVRCLCCIRSW